MQDDATIEQLSAYLDGELTDSEVAELEHRLARDPALQTELDSLRSAVDLMRTHGPVQAPAALYGDILRAVEDEPMPGGLWAWLQRPFGLPLATVALAAIALLVVGVTITGAVVVNAPGALRPVVSDLPPDGWSNRRGDSAKDAVAAKSVDERKPPGAKDLDDGVADAAPSQAAAPETQGAPMDPEEARKDALRKKMKIARSDSEESAETEADQGTADGGGDIGTSVDNATQPTKGKMYSGHSLTSIALRPEDLERVAALYQKHAGTSKSSAAVAARIASMESGTRDFALTLPDERARNAFEQDLRRLFAGRVSSSVSKDDAFTMDHARMTLRLTVSAYAPATDDAGTEGGQAAQPPIRSLRKGKDSYDELEAAEPDPEPATEK